MSWFGRQLLSYETDDKEISYVYDEDGLRTQKLVNGVEHNYYYVNDLLSIEEIGDEYILYYRYDDNGVLAAVSRYTVSTGVTSFLNARTNTRGDVVALCNGNGKEIVKYSYDSWGKLISITNGEGEALGENTFGYMNSVRYRGYVYDQETGLYYLHSRYYDPETGRFLNADDVDYLGVSGTMLGYNAFAYCENEPVNASDPSGKIASKTLVKVLFSVVLNIGSLVLSDVIKYHLKYSNSRWSSVGTYLTTVVSSIYDALVNKGLVKIVISSAAKNIFNQLVDWFIHKKSFSIQTLLNACFNSMINYAISKFFKIKSPQFIRDIKDEARTIGIRGTVKLTEYLNNKIFKINLMNMGLSQLRGVMITLVKATYNYMFNVRI